MTMTYFLEKIAEHLYKEYGPGIQDQCLVFPNRRAGLYFLKYLASKTGKPIWAPGVKTINELFVSSTTLKLAESETLIFELYKVYKMVNREAESFDDFYFWGEMLVDDFDDTDKYMADTVKLFDNIADIRRIDEKFGGLSEEQLNIVRQFWVNFNYGSRTAEKEDFLKIWALLPGLYTAFRESLRSKGLGYEGMIYRELAEKCQKGHLPDFKWKKLHFTGFNALNKCEKVLLHALQKAGKARFYWDYDLSYTEKNQVHSAGFFIRSNLKELGNDMPPDWQYESHLSKPLENIHARIIETSSDIAQVKLVPELLESMGEIKSDEAHHTAIILAEESLLVPLLSTIPEFVEDVNVTMGYHLKFSPVYSLVRHLLLLQKNCRVEEGDVFFDHSDVLNLIRHSYFTIDPSGGENGLASELVSEKRQWISGSRFRDIAPFDMIFRKADSPVLLSSYIKSLLESIYISDPEDEKTGTYHSSEINIRNEFIYRTILAINRLDNVISASGFALTVSTWTKLLDRIIRGISIPFSGEPLRGIQIMGILETRALDFRNLIILSANEGILPKSSAGSSYIPLNLREAFGLPGTRHQDSIYSYYFYRLLHRAENITFIYNSNSEGIRTGEMSRFLLQLSYLSETKPDYLGLGNEIILPVRLPKSSGKSQRHVDRLEELYLKPASKALSPTAVNTWLNCRMKFFYKYVCGLKEPEKIVTEIDPAVFGGLLHGIMEKIYHPYRGKGLGKTDIDKILRNGEEKKNVINEVINTKYSKGNRSVIDGNIMIISDILNSYVNMILRYDNSVSPLKIVDLEKGVYSGIEINYDGKRTKITSGGYIDRLDIKDGIYRVVDYKTGNIPMEIRSVESLFDENDEKRNEAWFQILMYCEIFSLENLKSQVRPSMYALRSLAGQAFTDFLIVGADKDSQLRVDDYSLIREEYSDSLRKTIETIFDKTSRFTMTEHLRKCEYCPFRQLCRR